MTGAWKDPEECVWASVEGHDIEVRSQGDCGVSWKVTQFNWDSGRLRGRRTVWGSRGELRKSVVHGHVTHPGGGEGVHTMAGFLGVPGHYPPLHLPRENRQGASGHPLGGSSPTAAGRSQAKNVRNQDDVLKDLWLRGVRGARIFYNQRSSWSRGSSPKKSSLGQMGSFVHSMPYAIPFTG